MMTILKTSMINSYKNTVKCRTSNLFLLSICFFMGVETYGQIAQTGAIDEGQEEVDGELIVWSVPAEQKVRPEDQIETNNLIWNKKEKKINLSGAGNEHVPFQIVITAPVTRKGTPISDGFFVEASNLSSKAGRTIPKEQINFYLQHFIMLDGKSSPIGETGYWPDALAPIKKPFSMEAQYSIVKNRPIWVDLNIPTNTADGIYTGTITITQDAKPLKKLNLEIEVYNFSLPDKTPLITYMNISRQGLADFYNKAIDSDEIQEITQTYYDFLYDHRMEPWFNDMLLPDIEASEGNIKVSFDDSKYHYYMNELETKRVLLNALPRKLKEQITDKPFSEGFNKKVKAYLSQIESYFSRNGWKDRLVINSPIDEPMTLEEYKETRRWANIVHEATNGAPFLITRTPIPPKEHPDWGTLRGQVDNFSIHGNHLNNPEITRVINEEQEKGGEMTWYISCDQVYPQPNLFIDAPALDPVMIPWITERYKMDGFLYWKLNHWSQTGNPWLNAGTFHSGFICSGGWILNGEGSLIYPGDYTEQFTGQPNVNGPVSSIRLELMREGIEDHVYLSMLKDLGAGDFADKQVANLVIDVSAFSRNLEKLYLARKSIAKRLEELIP